MLAQIAQRVGAREVARRLGDQDLSTGCGNPRRAMNVDSNIALVGHSRLPRVHTHAYVDRTGCQRITPHSRSSKRIRCLRESDEECIALRVDLNTSMADKCVTQRAPMLGEDPP
jgi:hypothetical protein